MMQHPTVKFWNRWSCQIGDCTIGKDTTVHAFVSIHDGVHIGKRCQIQAYAFLPTGVFLEDDVFIGPHVVFTNDKKLSDRDDFIPVATYVEKGSKIGANTTIIAGVRIGKNAKIGAGSVVTKSIPAGETWIGNPARKMV